MPYPCLGWFKFNGLSVFVCIISGMPFFSGGGLPVFFNCLLKVTVFFCSGMICG